MSRRLLVATLLAVAIALVALGAAGCSTGTDGKSLVDAKCDTCHSMDFVTSASYTTEAEWLSIVERMEVKGLSIDDAERTAIVEYLVSQSAGE